MRSPDEEYWRRPDPNEAHAEPATDTTAAAGYDGPPATTPPPAGWRPPVVIEVPPPREMPGQDHESIDAAEHGARIVTYGIAMVAGAVALVLMCSVCARLLF